MTERDFETRRNRLGFGLLAVVLVILAGWALRGMAAVAVPVVLAVFVTLAVLPIDRYVAERMPRAFGWLGRAAVMLLLVVILGGFIGGLAYCVTRIVSEMPGLPQELDQMMPDMGLEGGGSEPGEVDAADVLGEDGTQAAGGDAGGDSDGAAARGSPAEGGASEGPDPRGALAEGLQDLLEERGEMIVGPLMETGTALARTVLGGMGVALGGMVLVLFLVLLALTEAPTWEKKFDRMPSRPGHGNWRRANATMGAALRRFIATRALVGVISAVAYSAYIWPFGLDLILVWAILTFLMNFLPNIGAVISGVFPTIFAFLTLDPYSALLIAAGLIVIEQVIGNWIDPKLQGDSVALSPLVILIAVIFWGWIWGVAGAFLGTPMTLAIMILANNVEGLRPVALFLSNQPSSEDLDEKLGWT
jgi:AI-2 transport protein TqsA